jgi:hypothetical protein
MGSRPGRRDGGLLVDRTFTADRVGKSAEHFSGPPIGQGGVPLRRESPGKSSRAKGGAILTLAIPGCVPVFVFRLRSSRRLRRVRHQHNPPSRTAPGHAIDIGHQAVGWSEHEAALLQVADDLYENSVVSRRRLPRCQGNARPGSSWTPVFTAGQYNLGIVGPKFLWRALDDFLPGSGL